LIRVRVEGTVAILEGRVADVLQGLRAAQVAGGVPGVRWVINNLEVAT
jgi:osmotically-inducible protein OsmY